MEGWAVGEVSWGLGLGLELLQAVFMLEEGVQGSLPL